MVKENILNGDYVFKQKSRLKYITLTDDLHVFEYKNNIRMEKSSSSPEIGSSLPSVVNESGFINNKNLENLINGKGWEREKFTMLMSKENREIFRQKGYYENRIYIFDELLIKNEYESILSGKANLDDVIIHDIDSNMVFDFKGNAIPQPIACCYLNGHFSDRKYNLPKLVDILSKRKDIIFKDSEGGFVIKDAKENAIQDIPYYNEDCGNECVYFTWQANRNDYQKLWNECQKIDKEYPKSQLHKSIFNLDLLGLRKGGAALYPDDYYKKTPIKVSDLEDYDI